MTRCSFGSFRCTIWPQGRAVGPQIRSGYRSNADVRGPAKSGALHLARSASRPRSPPRLPLPAAREGAARHAGHRSSPPAEDHQRSRLFLAQARLPARAGGAGGQRELLERQAPPELRARPAGAAKAAANRVGRADRLGMPNEGPRPPGGADRRVSGSLRGRVAAVDSAISVVDTSTERERVRKRKIKMKIRIRKKSMSKRKSKRRIRGRRVRSCCS